MLVRKDPIKKAVDKLAVKTVLQVLTQMKKKALALNVKKDIFAPVMELKELAHLALIKIIVDKVHVNLALLVQFKVVRELHAVIYVRQEHIKKEADKQAVKTVLKALIQRHKELQLKIAVLLVMKDPIKTKLGKIVVKLAQLERIQM